MLSDLDRLEGKGVVRVAVKRAGGQENAVSISRIDRAATFSDYANLDNSDKRDRQIPLDVAIDLDLFNDDARIVGWAAKMLGCRLAKIRPAASPSTVDALIAAAATGAQAVAAGWNAHADQVWTSAEIADVRSRILVAIGDYEGLLALLDGMSS